MDTNRPSNEQDYSANGKPLLFVLSGPSGVGKDAVLAKIKESSIPLTYIVTTTTRPARKNEINGKDYTFLTKEQFQNLIDDNGLLEWANVYGNFYGVPAKDVEDALSAGHDVMVKVDIQGVTNILKKKPDAVTIFLVPPSLDELFERLKSRKTESESSLKIRMKTASEEMEAISGFDYAVVNADGEIDEAVADIKSIIRAEKCRVKK